MKKVLFLVLFVIASTITNARTISMCLTTNSAVADLLKKLPKEYLHVR